MRIGLPIRRRHRPSPSLAPRAIDPSTENRGTVLAPDEVADYESLRELVSPGKSLALLDDFAKWLFAVTATVGALGTAFGVSDANDLHGVGRTLFAAAVACAGTSLACAALARLPLPKRVNRYSTPSMAEHVQLVLKVRGRLLAVGAILFAAALVLAGLSPLFS